MSRSFSPFLCVFTPLHHGEDGIDGDAQGQTRMIFLSVIHRKTYPMANGCAEADGRGGGAKPALRRIKTNF